jgi:hypothetical protein
MEQKVRIRVFEEKNPVSMIVITGFPATISPF